LGQQYLHDFEQQQQQQRDGDDSRKQGSSGLAAFAGKMPLATGSNRGDTPSGNGACKRIGAAAGLLGISSGSRCGSNGAHGRGHDAAVSSRFFFSHDAVMQQLLSYSQAISAAVPSMDMARREFAWRNGFFLGLPQGRTPLHVDWLQRAGCGDLLAA
jgi:hypothetical protein